MPRGNTSQAKVHFSGQTEDFIVFVDDVEEYKKWKTDKSIPLAQVVDSFKIFVTHKHGSQGVLDGASNASLENEFGTKNEDEVIMKILEGGELKAGEFGERQGPRNDSMGTRAGH